MSLRDKVALLLASALAVYAFLWSERTQDTRVERLEARVTAVADLSVQTSCLANELTDQWLAERGVTTTPDLGGTCMEEKP